VNWLLILNYAVLVVSSTAVNCPVSVVYVLMSGLLFSSSLTGAEFRWLGSELGGKKYAVRLPRPLVFITPK